MSQFQVALDAIFGNLDDIMKMPLEKQARYCDHIARYIVDNDNMECLKSCFKENYAPEVWNSTSVGNVAYIILNCKDPEIKEKAQKVLNEYTVWYKAKHPSV